MTNTATNEVVPTWEPRHRLARAMEAAGLSAEDLAVLMEVHPSTVRNWVRGRSTLTASILFQAAAETGVSYRWLRWGEVPSNGSGGPRNGGSQSQLP